MIKKGLILIMTTALLVIIVGTGYASIFKDKEILTGNEFKAGVLDLKVDNQDNPGIIHISLSNMKPGDNPGCYKWELKNSGSIAGDLSVEFSSILNQENECNSPESKVDPDCNEGKGELGEYIKPTIGWGSCNLAYPSNRMSFAYTGPQNEAIIPGLNGLGGNTFAGFSNPLDPLYANQSTCFFMCVELDDDLRKWDGTQWEDVNENIIQSDSVVFDLIFQLQQTP